MSETNRSEYFFDLVYPGLLDSLRALGGLFVSGPSHSLGTRGDALNRIELKVKWECDDSNQVTIRVTNRLKVGVSEDTFNLGQWTRSFYSYDYSQKLNSTHFRIDLDSHSEHVHLLPNLKDHVPVANVDPDVRDIDPRQFVEMVATFRSTKVYPLSRKANLK